MSQPPNKDPGSPPPAGREALSPDAPGNAAWKWAKDSGRQLLESTSMILKRLDVPGLKLEEDVRAQPKTAALRPVKRAEPAGNAGYDPYGNKRVVARPGAKKPAPAPLPPQSWWRRLFRRD